VSSIDELLQPDGVPVRYGRELPLFIRGRAAVGADPEILKISVAAKRLQRARDDRLRSYIMAP